MLEILEVVALEGVDIVYDADSATIVYNKSADFTDGRFAKIVAKINSDANEGVYELGLDGGAIVSLVEVDGVEDTIEYNAVLSGGALTVKNYLPGDADGDGVVGLGDVLIIKQYISTPENVQDKIIVDAADVNGDGNVNRLDVQLLSKYCVGWDVELN